ncbi:UDP-phosphate galactose phosphotransferase [Ectothiorhodospira mobilis]|nr:UDP-phosphate galactose phosphotransferase [Ectothiorhodospira mobilis]
MAGAPGVAGGPGLRSIDGGPPAPGPREPSGGRRPLRIRHFHLRILGRELSSPFLLLFCTEALVLALAILLTGHGLSRTSIPPADATVGSTQIVLFMALNMVGMLCMGLYRRGFRGGVAAVASRIIGALSLGTVLLTGLVLFFPGVSIPWQVLLTATGLALPGLLAVRLGIYHLVAHDAFKRRVLVLGAGEGASMFQRLRRRSDRVAFTVVGFVPGGEEHIRVADEPVVRLDEPLPEFVRRHHIDDVVVAYDDPRRGFPADELMHCKMHGLNVLDVADFFEREAGLLRLDILRPSSFVFGRGFRHSVYRDHAKRVLDVVTSLALLGLTWPLMLICALGIALESRGRGSVIFRQVRTGQKGQPFTLFKFRSMVMDAEKDGKAVWAQKQDPRVTRFGAFMRKTRLDELPQLFNVLRGDMSFVGPRPERPEFVESLAVKLPYYRHRHWVKPGLTGWAQIHYPYGASEEDAFEKLKYDLYYVKNQSMALDLLTILQTVEVVLWGRGSR